MTNPYFTSWAYLQSTCFPANARVWSFSARESIQSNSNKKSDPTKSKMGSYCVSTKNSLVSQVSWIQTAFFIKRILERCISLFHFLHIIRYLFWKPVHILTCLFTLYFQNQIKITKNFERQNASVSRSHYNLIFL